MSDGFVVYVRDAWRRKARARWRELAAQLAQPYPDWWLAEAMCVHSHEGSWTEPGGIGPMVSGGMQIGYNEWHTFGGGAYADWPYQATPTQQLTVAWRYYSSGAGWRPWPATAAMCGLL